MSNRMARACALTLGLAGASLAQADTLLYTNANWLVTPNAPGAGWNSEAAFDTSSWQSATVLYNVSSYAGYESYSAQGIWSSSQTSFEASMWARTVWQLDALPLTASLAGGFDDDGVIYINGQQVAISANGNASDGVANADLLPYLQVGANVVAYSATDNFPVYGFNHSSWLQIDGQPGVAAPVPEPQTYALMLAGLAATAFAVKRRRRNQETARPRS